MNNEKENKETALAIPSGAEVKRLLATEEGTQKLLQLSSILLDGKAYIDLDAYRAAEEVLRAVCNYCAPLRKMNRIPKCFGIEPRVVIVDARPIDKGGEVFRTVKGYDGKPDKWSFGKVVMMKLSQAAGINWLSSVRHDDASDPHYAEIEVHGSILGFDGSWKHMTGRKSVDLRDGSGEAKEMSPGQLAQARRFPVELAETKAKKRAISQHLCLEGSYTLEQLNKPFVVPAVVIDSENTDSEHERAVIRAEIVKNAMRGRAALYGSDPSTSIPALPPVKPPPPLEATAAQPEYIDEETGEVRNQAEADPFSSDFADSKQPF